MNQPSTPIPTVTCPQCGRQPIECPQCEKNAQTLADEESIGDYGLCLTCLDAWRKLRNQQPENNDGFSEQPPFLPIPEYWARHDLPVPEADDSQTLYYGLAFCDDVLKGPYNTEQRVMAEKCFLLDDNAWPVAVIKLTMPANVQFEIKAFMTMRDDTLLEEGEE